jgi:hypothetical protein
MISHHLPKILWTILLLLIGYVLPAQTRVSGTITDAATHQPLKSVSIQFKGSRRGTTSDVDGKYTLSLDGNYTQIQFSYVGYKALVKNIEAGKEQMLDVALETATDTSNVYVKPHKVKYRNKDNPAVELIEKVIAHKDSNQIGTYQFASYQQYEKMQLAISNLSEKLKNNKLLRRYSFLLDNKDTTLLEQGRSVVPVYMEENISQNYYRKKPEKRKQIIVAQKQVDLGSYIDNAGVKTYLKYLYQDINVYDNNIFLLTNQFLSPIAGMAPTFYMYTIMDTVRSANGDSLVKLNFTPRNPNDLLFRGTMYITLDGRYAVEQMNLTLSKYANLNWVREMHIGQYFTKDSLTGRYRLSKSSFVADFGISKSKRAGGVYGERTVSFRDYQIDKPLDDSLFDGEAVVTLPPTAATDSFLLVNRHDTLSTAEAKVYKNVDSLVHMKSVRTIMEIASILLSGYKQLGPVEIGPIAGFYSFNPIEGLRLRFGGRTRVDPYFSNRVQLEGYTAYGFKDERWKYYGGITYSLTNRNIFQFPVKYVKVSYQRDTRIPGQDLQLIQESSLFLSFKRGVNDKWLYNDVYKVEWFNETKDHFSQAIGYRNWKQEAAGGLQYGKMENGTYTNVKNLTASELYTELRWALGEQFYQGKVYRTLLTNNKPIFRLRVAAGFKGFLGGEYNYKNINLNIEKRFLLSQFGYADVVVDGGVTLGQVPYPLLTIHRANQTYAYQLYSYNLMNFLEFVSDHYASFNLDYKFNGFLLNKVPLVKKLKLREAFSFKLLAGGLRSENNPSLNPSLIGFGQVNGVNTTYPLNRMPYMEGSVGLMNIFKFLRIDLVRRFNYLDHPNVTTWGIRGRVRGDF